MERHLVEQIRLQDWQRGNARECHSGLLELVPLTVDGMQPLECVSDQVGGKCCRVREVDGELIDVLLDGRIKRVRSDKDRDAPTERVLLAQLLCDVGNVRTDGFFHFDAVRDGPAEAFCTHNLFGGVDFCVRRNALEQTFELPKTMSVLHTCRLWP